MAWDEIGKGAHLIVEDDEIAAIAIIDERGLDSPYYLAPADRIAQEAFAIIGEAIRKTPVVGMARVVLQKRERILMLEPFGRGMLATTFRYASQDLDRGAAFEDLAETELQRRRARESSSSTWFSMTEARTVDVGWAEAVPKVGRSPTSTAHAA